MKPSSGIMLIWRFAADEAERSGHEFIEPEHFVQAMTRGESLTHEYMLKFVIPDDAVRRATAAELAVVQDALSSLGINTVTLRRSLRARLGKGNHPHDKGEPIHRTERCRRIFAAAETLAGEAGSPVIQAPHLFLAVLREKESLLVAAIQTAGGNQQAVCRAIGKRLKVAVPADHVGPATPAESTPRHHPGLLRRNVCPRPSESLLPRNYTQTQMDTT